MEFEKTDGYDWIYGDWRTNKYNGPYPNGSYFSNGNKFAWLGTDQGSGIIKFTGATTAFLSLKFSAYSGLTIDAYDKYDHIITSDSLLEGNTKTGKMDELSLEAANISYIKIHDSGNFWLIDDLEMEDLTASNLSNLPGKYRIENEKFDIFNTGDVKTYAYNNQTTQEIILKLSWQGSKFKLKAISPNGEIISEESSDNPPLEIIIPSAETGEWSFEISAIDVDIDGTAAFLIGKYNQNDYDFDFISNDYR